MEILIHRILVKITKIRLVSTGLKIQPQYRWILTCRLQVVFAYGVPVLPDSWHILYSLVETRRKLEQPIESDWCSYQVLYDFDANEYCTIYQLDELVSGILLRFHLADIGNRSTSV